jgi:kynurenine formamidase
MSWVSAWKPSASLRNLDQLPATGAIVIAAPLKIVNGSGSPLRVLAIAPS